MGFLVCVNSPLSPPRPEGARRRDSRNLGPTFEPIHVPSTGGSADEFYPESGANLTYLPHKNINDVMKKKGFANLPPQPEPARKRDHARIHPFLTMVRNC